MQKLTLFMQKLFQNVPYKKMWYVLLNYEILWPIGQDAILPMGS
jgi:hypothetical protein